MTDKNKNKQLSAFMADDSNFQNNALGYLFAEEPVSLDEFLYSSDYLNFPSEPGLSEVQYDVLKHAERVLYQETFDLMAEHYGGYWEEVKDVRNTNILNIMWGKGSTAPETPIYDAQTGKWPTLKSFSGGLVATAAREDGKVITGTGTEAFIEGEGDMYTVTFKSGRQIKVWEGHRFLGWNREKFSSGRKVSFAQSQGISWKRLWDMRVGDHVAVSSYVPEPKETLVIPDWAVEWAGLIIGDGCVSGEYKHNLVIGHQSPVELAHVTKMIEGLSLKASIRDDGSKYIVTPTMINKKKHGNPLREVLREFGILGTNSHTKKIPDEFYSLSNKQVALFISRLIDTDGWISISNTIEIGYGSVSEELIDGILRLLLRLGVFATKVRKKSTYKGENHFSWQLKVRRDEDVRNLLNQLTLLDKEVKREEALKWLDSNSRKKQDLRHGDLVWDVITDISYEGVGEYWTLTVPETESYVSDGGVYNHNSGKDAIIGLAVLRIVYLLLCLRSPQNYYGFPDSSLLHILNVASNSNQARQAFYEPMARASKRGWFAGKAVVRKTSISFDKGIEVISGHSKTENQEGYSLIASILDEVDSMDSIADMRGLGRRSSNTSNTVEGMVKMLRTSSSTRFPRTYKAITISYPRTERGPIMRMVKEAKEEIAKIGRDSNMYYSGPYATWEANPLRTKEDFALDYARDPVEAAAKYECKPVGSTNPFFRDMEIFKKSIDRPEEAIKVTYELRTVVSEETGVETAQWEPIYEFADWFQPVPGALYAMHGDLAILGDRAGVAMSHVSEWVEKEITFVNEQNILETRTERLPIIKNDFTISYEAEIGSNPAREIKIRWARELAFELIRRGFNVARMTYDQFQSKDSMQILEESGIETDRVSTDINNNVWRTLKDVASDGRLRMADNPLLLGELKSLIDLGKKVDHPPYEGKDLADAFACSIVGAIELGGEEDYGYEEVQAGDSIFNYGITASDLALPSGFGVDLNNMLPAGLTLEAPSGPY